MFTNANSKMKPYKKADLDYDIACGWIVMVVEGVDEGAAEGHCSVTETLKEHSDMSRANTVARLCNA